MKILIVDIFEFLFYKLNSLSIRLQNNTYTVTVPNSDYIALDKSLLLRVKCITIIKM